MRGRGFPAFLEAFIRCVRLLRSGDEVAAAAGGLFDALRREGVRYAEVTFSPQSHVRRGLPLAALVAGLDAARRKAASRGGPSIAYIADGGRLWGAAWLEQLADELAAFRSEGVVALGLGGDETILPARAFRRAFRRAAARGLRLVAHAGEGTTARAVREAIDELGAERIGHGISAASDPRLLDLLARRAIPLEICPTSNVLTGAVRSLKTHPLRRIVESGVPVVIGSDDRTIFGTSLRGELKAAVHRCGLPRSLVPELLANAIDFSFAPRRLRRDLHRDLRRALRRHPTS